MASPTPTPSPVLNGLLDDLHALDDVDLTAAVLEAEKARRRSDAEFAVKVVAVYERALSCHRFIGAAMADVGMLLGLTARASEHLVEVSVQITDRPLVWNAWHDALIDKARAQVIVTVLADIPDPHREELEAQAIGYAVEHSTAQLKRKLLAMTCDHDPDETLRKEAVDRRGVGVEPAGHGMSHIWAYVSAEHAEAFLQTLDQQATAAGCPDPYGQGDARTLEQRRADAFTAHLDDHSFYDIAVNVLIPADMLMGVETSGANLNGSPITHALAVKLAWSPDARWTRLVTDPLTGVLMDVGREKYEIPAPVRNAIRLRDDTCRHPFCTRKAEYTDTDHVIAHAISHRTDPSGLVPMCRYHHRGKTFGQWTLTTTSTYARDLTWHSPLGHTKTTRPPNHRRS